MAGGIDWLRWHHGTVTDPKFLLCARKSGASLPDVLAVWAYLLEKASAATDRGSFGEIDAESLDCMFGFPATETRTADILAAFDARKLTKDGRLVAWEVRQPKREREDDTAAERKRAQREREKVNPPTKQEQVTPRHTASHQETPRGEESREELSPEASRQSPEVRSAGTTAGLACRLMREAGCVRSNPSHPDLLAALDEGVSPEVLADTVREAVAAGVRQPFAYAITTARSRKAEGARAVATGPPRQLAPSRQFSALAAAQELIDAARKPESEGTAEARRLVHGGNC